LGGSGTCDARRLGAGIRRPCRCRIEPWCRLRGLRRLQATRPLHNRSRMRLSRVRHWWSARGLRGADRRCLRRYCASRRRPLLMWRTHQRRARGFGRCLRPAGRVCLARGRRLLRHALLLIRGGGHSATPRSACIQGQYSVSRPASQATRDRRRGILAPLPFIVRMGCSPRHRAATSVARSSPYDWRPPHEPDTLR